MAEQTPRVQKLDLVEYITLEGVRGNGIVIDLRDPKGTEDPQGVILRVWCGGKELEIREAEARVLWSIQERARHP